MPHQLFPQDLAVQRLVQLHVLLVAERQVLAKFRPKIFAHERLRRAPQYSLKISDKPVIRLDVLAPALQLLLLSLLLTRDKATPHASTWHRNTTWIRVSSRRTGGRIDVHPGVPRRTRPSELARRHLHRHHVRVLAELLLLSPKRLHLEAQRLSAERQVREARRLLQVRLQARLGELELPFYLEVDLFLLKQKSFKIFYSFQFRIDEAVVLLSHLGQLLLDGLGHGLLALGWSGEMDE